MNVFEILFGPSGYSGDAAGMQQARCPECGVSLGSMEPNHVQGCSWWLKQVQGMQGMEQATASQKQHER